MKRRRRKKEWGEIWFMYPTDKSTALAKAMEDVRKLFMKP